MRDSDVCPLDDPPSRHPQVVIDSLDRTMRLRLIADATFYDLPELTEALVVPPVGAEVRYAYNRPFGNGSSGGLNRGGQQVVLCTGTVVGYEHHARSWRVKVSKEAAVSQRGVIPSASSWTTLSAPRDDDFSWHSAPGVRDAERILMPVDQQRTSAGRPLATFERGPYNTRRVEWLTDDGRWVDLVEMPVVRATGAFLCGGGGDGASPGGGGGGGGLSRGGAGAGSGIS